MSTREDTARIIRRAFNVAKRALPILKFHLLNVSEIVSERPA